MPNFSNYDCFLINYLFCSTFLQNINLYKMLQSSARRRSHYSHTVDDFYHKEQQFESVSYFHAPFIDAYATF